MKRDLQKKPAKETYVNQTRSITETYVNQKRSTKQSCINQSDVYSSKEIVCLLVQDGGDPYDALSL